MRQVLYILLGCGLTLATATALGMLLLQRLRLVLYRQEQLFFSFVVGSGCLSFLVFSLAAAGFVQKGVFLAIAVLAICLAVRTGAIRFAGDALPPLPPVWRYLSGAIFIAFTTVYFVNAMAPEVSADGSTYHLGLVARYMREHGFHRITNNVYASLAQGLEMLFLFAYAFGRHSAAALVHLAFLVALAFGMLSYGRRFGFAEAGAAGAVLVFASPIAGFDASVAYNDVAVACAAFALFYVLQIWAEERKSALLVPAGLLAGFCFAIKYTAFVAPLYAVGFLVFMLRRDRRMLWRGLAITTGCATLLAVPWLAKNYLWVANPFSPFLNRLFPNPYTYILFETEYAWIMRHYEGLRSYWDIPLEVTVRGATLQGLLGPVFLLVPVAILAWRSKAGKRLLIAGALFILPYAANIGTRFLIPALPFFALAMALVLTRSRDSMSFKWSLRTSQSPGARTWNSEFNIPKSIGLAVVCIHSILSWPWLIEMYSHPHAMRLTRFPLAAALRVEPEEQFLMRIHDRYLAARLLETETPRGARAFSFNQLPDAYSTRDTVVGYQSALGNRITDLIHTPMEPDFLPTRRWAFRFASQTLSRIRVVQTAKGPDNWSVSEFRVFQGNRQLARAAQWRLTSKPNPWDLELAFDGNPATRWRAWEDQFPGMYIEVDFGRPETLDSVYLDTARAQYNIKLKLEGQSAGGSWRDLAAAPEMAQMPEPPGIRHAAMKQIKDWGIGYLMLDTQEREFPDLQRHANEWGIEYMTQRGRATLYRIE
jgi:hypothetical protein